MINEGTYIEKALQTLDDIVARMESDQDIKPCYAGTLLW